MAVGLENLAELREEVRQQMERDYAVASRLRLKRTLLDKLAERYDFPVPPGMVDLEFENIWAQHQAEKSSKPSRLPQAGAQPQKLRNHRAKRRRPPAIRKPTRKRRPTRLRPLPRTARNRPRVPRPRVRQRLQTQTPRRPPRPRASRPRGRHRLRTRTPRRARRPSTASIAERRVRLGLLLAEVGRSNNITVTQDELNQAITREVRRHPGYERQALDFYRQNPEAVASLRAPIFEDKVVDFIVELAKAPERRVTPQELLALPDLDGDDAATDAAGEPPA